MPKLSKVILLFATTSLLAVNSYANDKSNPLYVEFNTGLAIKKGKEKSFNEEYYNNFSKTNKHKNSALISGSVGYRFSPNFRTDLNLTYLPEWKVNDKRVPLDPNNGDGTKYQASLSSLSTTVNAYYDFTNFQSYGFTPYVTAGIGYSNNKIAKTPYYNKNEISIIFLDSSNSNLTWKVGAGLNYKLSDKSYLNLGYRYANLGRVKTKVAYGMRTQTMFTDTEIFYKKITSHQVLIGIGFNI